MRSFYFMYYKKFTRNLKSKFENAIWKNILCAGFKYSNSLKKKKQQLKAIN